MLRAGPGRFAAAFRACSAALACPVQPGAGLADAGARSLHGPGRGTGGCPAARRRAARSRAVIRARCAASARSSRACAAPDLRGVGRTCPAACPRPPRPGRPGPAHRGRPARPHVRLPVPPGPCRSARPGCRRQRRLAAGGPRGGPPRTAHPRPRPRRVLASPLRGQCPQPLLRPVRRLRRVRGDLRAIQRHRPALPIPSRAHSISTCANSSLPGQGTRPGTGIVT